MANARRTETVVTVCVGILLAAALAREAAGQASQSNASDEAAIEALVASYADARAQEDPARIAALFTGDADQLVSSGEWRRGRDAVVRGTMATSRRTGGKRTLALETIRFLAPEVALADARYEIAGTAEGTRRMWSTFVLARTPAGWRIAAIRNMLPAPPAR